MPRREKVQYRIFRCPVCGVEVVAPKKRRTSKGHIKTMVCHMCKEKRDFEQVDEK